ncbi:hypothetical protein, partial [Dictyobacter arantiisoli]|uniref:hypothetical protein n=1 Tax=Dictyobacter arantiisoli TaxID=2014874 RepID=UPI001C0EC7F5
SKRHKEFSFWIYVTFFLLCQKETSFSRYLSGIALHGWRATTLSHWLSFPPALVRLWGVMAMPLHP